MLYRSCKKCGYLSLVVTELVNFGKCWRCSSFLTIHSVDDPGKVSKVEKPSHDADQVERKDYLSTGMIVPNNGSFRKGVQVKVLGFHRWRNDATQKWMSTAILVYRWPSPDQWHLCADIAATMSYADHYHWLHPFPLNPPVKYGKPGKRTPTYNPLCVRFGAGCVETKRLLKEAGF